MILELISNIILYTIIRKHSIHNEHGRANPRFLYFSQSFMVDITSLFTTRKSLAKIILLSMKTVIVTFLGS